MFGMTPPGMPIAPSTSSPNQYSMGSTGDITNNGSGIRPAQFTMPGTEQNQAQAEMAMRGAASRDLGGYAQPSGMMPANPTFYGR